jgi:hypothetical protein
MAEAAPKVLGEVMDYVDLVDVLRSRVEELNVLLGSIDRIAGITETATSHMLARIPNRSVLTAVNLGPLLATLGIKLIVVEDLDRLEKSRRHPAWEAKRKSYVRSYRKLSAMFIDREARRLAARETEAAA